jgi:hypothetical protein
MTILEYESKVLPLRQPARWKVNFFSVVVEQYTQKCKLISTSGVAIRQLSPHPRGTPKQDGRWQRAFFGCYMLSLATCLAHSSALELETVRCHSNDSEILPDYTASHPFILYASVRAPCNSLHFPGPDVHILLTFRLL